MANSTDHETNIKSVIDFWFSLTPTEWFKDSAKHDETITAKFASLVEQARLTDELDGPWTSTASGSLALILLLDQFTRNIFRPGKHPNPGLSWSADAKAFDIATVSTAKGFDRRVQREYASHRDMGYSHRLFFYLPFQHAEDLSAQVASVALNEVLIVELEMFRLRKERRGEALTDDQQGLLQFIMTGFTVAAKHRDCIAALGRFPSRNKPLGREHTADEVKWLEEHPTGW